MRPEIFDFFTLLVEKVSGISLKTGKEYLVENRLNELARSLGYRDHEELYQVARSKLTRQLLEQIVDALTTNETYFFRDQHPFESLRKHIIPELKEKRSGLKRLTFWSAACSTGQEPYSLAILLKEYFPDLVSSWRVEILASDISESALKKAREGVYTQIEVNRGLPVTFLVKYFKQTGSHWKVAEELKNLVKFRKINLVEPLRGVGSFDVILCRYVLIYFAPAMKKRVWENLCRVLNPGGYLILGATEFPPGLPPDMEKKILGKTVCFRRKD
ncbi:protein-glutamate O-methyltransferase CheR [Thermosulfurimonas marina]|uniref:protein-glutamate O-methyltransferase n=1 Tax=Thermosulfurimonas marina TaxID=2047767 RepID=A0A6H1WQP4_9BACT|nr:protein-glutamate O-methyltransferase CheR [Thermosulfurimonas marina]QJA05511.1 protein-glutamate O-methyltransferase CheR [Thermosulfurimonas marina]